jgi:hypothetical protein
MHKVGRNYIRLRVRCWTLNGEASGLAPEVLHKVHGCQDVFAGGTNNFDSTYDTYAGSGWTRYEIPVGEAVTGNATELHLINDDDDQCGRGSGSARFRNVRLVERPD